MSCCCCCCCCPPPRTPPYTHHTRPPPTQVFLPKEDLSLDVIKQYRVVCPTGADKVRVLKDMIFPLVGALGWAAWAWCPGWVREARVDGRWGPAGAQPCCCCGACVTDAAQ